MSEMQVSKGCKERDTSLGESSMRKGQYSIIELALLTEKYASPLNVCSGW